MLKCECGFVYHPTEGERFLSSKMCPKCGRKMKKGETWIMPIGKMNMFEAVKNNGNEAKYLKDRRKKCGY